MVVTYFSSNLPQPSSTPMLSTPVTNDRAQATRPSKCESLLTGLDIFSYVPEPEAYPVSTTKSQIGSLILILAVLGYLIFDFVQFMTANTPVINSYERNVPENVKYQMPKIAFGFVYGPALNFTLNDPSYLNFEFISIETSVQNLTTGNITQTRTTMNLTANCNPEWLGEFASIYRNLTCVNTSTYLMNVPAQSPQSVVNRLLVYACRPGGNTTCQNSTQLSSMTSGGRLILLVDSPVGFDYKAGQAAQDGDSVEIYQFFLIPGTYNRLTLEFYLFQYVTFPTYLTTFTQKSYTFMQSYEPSSRISNVSLFNPYLMTGITFEIFRALTIVNVQYQTFINRVSQWGALASLIMAVFGICCLAYNKNKFLNRNPGWSNFDQAMKKKNEAIEIEMHSVALRKDYDDEEDNIGGISHIRQRLEQQKQL